MLLTKSFINLIPPYYTITDGRKQKKGRPYESLFSVLQVSLFLKEESGSSSGALNSLFVRPAQFIVYEFNTLLTFGEITGNTIAAGGGKPNNR